MAVAPAVDTLVVTEDLSDLPYTKVHLQPLSVHLFTPEHRAVVDFYNYNSSRYRHLHCVLCGSIWCDHVAHVLTRRWDWRMLMSESKVFVPIVPTVDCWMKVSLVDLGDGTREAVIEVDRESWAAKMFGTAYPTICYMVEGESLMTMREAMGQYLDACTENGLVTLYCKNNERHTFQYLKAWDVSQANKNTWYAQQWSVFTTGLCVRCVQSNESMAAAVPEV